MSLEELFRVRRGPLLRFVIARTKDETEAEEIVQEAFIRFQKKYDPALVDSPEALLARIAANLVIDHARARDARAAREDAWGKLNLEGAGQELSQSKAVDPYRSLASKQQMEAALATLEKLPEKTRRIFFLHRFDGLTYGEISARTAIPKSTIEKHMIRAIRALAEMGRL